MNTDVLKQYEDDVNKILESMEPAHELIIYKTLYNKGHRQEYVREKIDKIKDYKPLKKVAEADTNATDALKQLYGLGYI